MIAFPLSMEMRRRFGGASVLTLSRCAALGFLVLLPLTVEAQTATPDAENPPPASTETGQIEGRVLNAQTNRYMTRAQVEILGTANRVFTNQFGEYRFYGLEPGEYQVRASFTGMAPQTLSVQVASGDTVRQDFFFREAVAPKSENEGAREDTFELEEFEVRAIDNFQTAQEIAIQEERFSVNFKSVVDTDAFGITAQGNVGEFVKYIPGVTIGYGGGHAAGGTYASGNDANTISIRGYSARETTITIDGIPIANAAPGTLDPAVGLDMLSINNASRIEVIKVPSPDQPNAGVGGSVNLISKTAFEYPKPTLNFRIYLGLNSENLHIFDKTPGPMNRPTYKSLPGFDLTYALPINDNFGLSVTLASANQVNEGHELKMRVTRQPQNLNAKPFVRKADDTFRLRNSDTSVNTEYSYWLTEDPHFAEWQQQYGEDWTNWTEDELVQMYMTASGATESSVRGRLDALKWLPRYDSQDRIVGVWSPDDKEDYESTLPYYRDENGNLVGRVYADWNHPYVNRVQVTDSPRISHRNSAALKFDWRPFDGLLVTTNYQISTFEDESADRRVHQIAGTPTEYGVDYVLSENGGVRLDTDAFGREGTTHNAYVKARYIKGPWDIYGFVSYSHSESDLISIENGHFSVVEVSMGGVDYTEFLDIDADGVPQEINYYRIVDDGLGGTKREELDFNSLSNFSLNGYDPDDPDAGTLSVKAAGIHSLASVTAAKFDIRRDLDFLPWESINLAIKVGGDWEENENTKSGRGTGYKYIYLGEEDRILSLADFRDENYVNVDPGFGLEPLEWPDPYKIYDYMQEHPEAFSDTDDRVPSPDEMSVAASNYFEEVSTSKSITETKINYYAQMEADFFNGRLSMVGGFRMEKAKREGYDRGEDSYWNYLHFDRDEDGDQILDVFQDYEGIEIDPVYGITDGKLPLFDVTGPDVLLIELRTYGTWEKMPADRQAYVMQWYQYYEEAGAVYADGEPFVASEFVRVTRGSLRAVQYQYIKNYRIRQNAQQKPQPIISLSYDITDNWVARLSWATTFSKAPYESSEGDAGTLRRVQYVRDPSSNSGSMFVTNPDLKTSKTIGWDGAITYYSESGGKYELAVFYRTEYDRAEEKTFSSGSDAWEGVMAEIGYGPGNYFYENNWSVTTSVNQPGTSVKYGYEFEARQDLSVFGDWGKHFYFFGSIFQQLQKDQDLSDAIINASGGLNFNYRRLNLRVNATWHNERTDEDPITETIFWDDATVGNPGWYTATENDDDFAPYVREVYLLYPEDLRIDLTGSFRLSDHYSLDVSVRNLTNSNPEPYLVVEGEDGFKSVFGDVRDESVKSIYGVNFTVGISGRF